MRERRPDPDRPHQGVPSEDFTQAVYAGYEHAIVARTCRALAAETRSSDDCYFAIWAGIGADTTTIRALTARDDIDVVTADRYGRQPFYD